MQNFEPAREQKCLFLLNKVIDFETEKTNGII